MNHQAIKPFLQVTMPASISLDAFPCNSLAMGPVEFVEPLVKGLREVNGFFSCDFGESGDDVRPVD